MSCIAFLLRQTTPLSFICLPANTNQVSKANCFCLRFVCFCLLVFVFVFFLGRLRPLLTTDVDQRFVSLTNKLFVKIIGH